MGVTIRDVAANAGVSSSVVSMVLNGGGGKTVRVSEATRQRVVEVAARLGYRRHSQATGMRQGRFGTLALVLPMSGHAAYLPGPFVHELSVAVAALDMHLVVASMSDDQLSDPGYAPKIVRELAADGLLINYVADIPAPILALLNEHAVPCIWLNRKGVADCAAPADLDAGRAATEHLLAYGHRRIAFVYFGDGGHYSVDDRIAGYGGAMARRGLTPRVIASPFTVYSKRRTPEVDPRPAVVRAALTGPERPTAIVAYAEADALVVQNVASSLGLRVPEDLSIVGFHSDMIENGGLPITTFAHDTIALAAAGVDMLMRKINDPQTRVPPRHVPFLLQAGLSCAQCPQTHVNRPDRIA
jgi:LacI family transcriptional regulator